MTRFARAKGSKASNEKAPEDGTPWEVMKEQLLRAKQDTEEAKKREEVEKQRIENYENFLKEQKISKRKATWCDFPEAENSKKDLTKNDITPAKKKKKNKEKLNVSQQLESSQNDNIESEIVNKEISKKKKKKNKQKSNNVASNLEDNSNVIDNLESLVKKNNNNEQASALNDPNKNELPTEKKKNKKKKKNAGTTTIEDPDTFISNVKEDLTHKPVQKHSSSNIAQQNEKNKKRKNIQENGVPIRRKEIDDRSFQLIINGKEVELIRFEGFPIMKKDAERLQELKTSMIKKGIPKSEVQRTIKLERRRAEKALARLKRDVCYNCRKGGHNLSDCPELKSKIPGVDGVNDGMCFKCGSTEHRQFECKVQRDKEFRFATCFICKEQGHIARQCPDNPKGLYPNGGGCKLCGDVTHLKKDCPTTNNQKENTSVKLQVMNDGNIEDIEHKQNTVISEETARKPKKIKF